MFRKIIIFEDQLRELYLNQRKSSWTIAKELGVTQACIMDYLRRYNIPRRSYKENYIPTKGKHLSEIFFL